MSGEATPSRRAGLARVLGWPLRRVLDPRVRWTANLVDERLAARMLEQEQRLALTAEATAEIVGRLEEAKRLLVALQDHGNAVEARVDSNERRLLALLGSLHVQVGGAPLSLEGLSDDIASFLNWSAGPDGYAAQAGLWFNPPVPVEHRAGAVAPLLVNERIIEQPFAFAALSRLGPGRRILDIGGSESTLGLSLASLGHEVTVVDPRGLALEHPNLRVVAAPLEELDQDAGYDAAIAISAVEHFGLAHYGGTPEAGASERREDLAAIASLREHVRPGGLLVLSVPLGEPSVDDFQRVYDADGVRELVAGWEHLELGAAWRTDATTWLPGEIDQPAGEAGVALIVATNPGAPGAAT